MADEPVEHAYYQTDTVFPTGDGTWAFICPWDDDEWSGICGYASRGWESAEAARERGKEHLFEHIAGVPMSDMTEFMIRHGLADRHQAFGGDDGVDPDEDQHQAFPDQ